MENFSLGYQQISNYIQNIESEGNTTNIQSTNDFSSLNAVARLSGFINAEPLNAEPQETLFVPLMGQSNARHMSIIYDPYQPGSIANDTSGAIILDQELSNLTGSDVVTSDTLENNFAVGGSRVNGNGYFQDDNYVWWYPDQDQPGGALRQTEQRLKEWLLDQGAQPTDEIAIVWSQGESDVGDISNYDPTSREKYKESTVAVFDYLKSNLGYTNITFYLVPTGRFQTEAGANTGLSEEQIGSINEGREIVRDTQVEIALERDDVQLAPDYSDLNMVYEEGQLYQGSYDQDYGRWSNDIWHLGHDGLKVNGNRLAQYIALDRGQNNVISFTDSFGNPAQSVSLNRPGILDLNIAENSTQEVIRGSDSPDILVGSLSADEILGGNGNDVIVGTQGIDTLAGGNGNDVFFYSSSAYADGTVGDRILDFEPGSDFLDVSEPLELSGYAGVDPIADGYVIVNPLSENSLEVLFDSDGIGAQPASSLAVLENVDVAGFESNINTQFVIAPTEF